jgi:peptide-methionine (S)-S-oxide reductase
VNRLAGAPAVFEGCEMAQTEVIVLAGGCFWCTEAVFKEVRGVLKVESGYSNGQAERPTYEDVCSGSTDCAEVVKLTFDPAQIGLRQILEIFFVVHDPTQLDRQDNDVGRQYRSGIYTTTPAQEKIANDLIAEMTREQMYGAPIVTEVKPVAHFWPAEDYHANYVEQHPTQPYCMFVSLPKVEKFRQTFREWTRTEPARA